MFERTDDLQGDRRRRLGAPAALLLSALLSLLAFTATAISAQQGAGSAARRAGLAAEIEARYEVLPARDGLVLRPRSAGSGILAIEVADGEVAIDGEPADEDEVRAKLGGEADAVLRLAELDADEARALFHLGGAGGLPPEAPEEAELPTLPEPPEPLELSEWTGVRVGQRMSILSSAEVKEGERAEQAVAIGGSVTVDGAVDEDAVAVGGSVHVNG